MKKFFVMKKWDKNFGFLENYLSWLITYSQRVKIHGLVVTVLQGYVSTSMNAGQVEQKARTGRMRLLSEPRLSLVMGSN